MFASAGRYGALLGTSEIDCRDGSSTTSPPVYSPTYVESPTTAIARGRIRSLASSVAARDSRSTETTVPDHSHATTTAWPAVAMPRGPAHTGALRRIVADAGSITTTSPP